MGVLMGRRESDQRLRSRRGRSPDRGRWRLTRDSQKAWPINFLGSIPLLFISPTTGPNVEVHHPSHLGLGLLGLAEERPKAALPSRYAHPE